MKHLIGMTLAAFLMSGCAMQTFSLNSGGSATPAKEEMQHFFISGLGQEQSINAAAVCGGANKVGKVEVQQTFLDGFLGVITFGIYTPRDARVFCTK